jgi:hypothetical protein
MPENMFFTLVCDLQNIILKGMPHELGWAEVEMKKYIYFYGESMVPLKTSKNPAEFLV